MQLASFLQRNALLFPPLGSKVGACDGRQCTGKHNSLDDDVSTVTGTTQGKTSNVQAPAQTSVQGGNLYPEGPPKSQ